MSVRFWKRFSLGNPKAYPKWYEFSLVLFPVTRARKKKKNTWKMFTIIKPWIWGLFWLLHLIFFFSLFINRFIYFKRHRIQNQRNSHNLVCITYIAIIFKNLFLNILYHLKHFLINQQKDESISPSKLIYQSPWCLSNKKKSSHWEHLI